MAPLRIGFGVPRWVGDPSAPLSPLDHRMMLRYGQLAEQLGFDSVWVPDHFFYEWPPGVFEPYPEAWTLLTAVGATTERVQIGSLVLAAAFRHPALLAKMAGALQEVTNGRLLLGIGAGNQLAEHTAFGLGFERRVSRLAEYLEILRALLANERVTLEGRHYTVHAASLQRPQPPVPIWLAGTGPRLSALVARYASGWNWGDGLGGDGAPFRSKLAELRRACEQRGRDPDELEISCSTNVLVLADAAATRALVERIGSVTGWPPAKVRDQYVIGTPDEVAQRLTQAVAWGATHLVCSLGGRPFTLWSEAMLELFASDVLPRLRASTS
jgi:alkanesulfonate monooxygenase SsuD/methylene tetrahydromethanopterin reductase-like flavin-dependent oxidoreductase (luciferase family)